MNLRSNNKGATRRRSRRTKAQALLEFALLGTVLAMLLAGAADLGRAYYTSVVVENMAGEGAAYASTHPDKDANPIYQTAMSCSRYSITSTQTDTIQERARRVAIDRGLVISKPTQSQVEILDDSGATSACNTRCEGTTITVRVTYQITDLFLPGLLGMNSITIRKSASQRLMTSSYAAQAAGTCSP